MAARADCARREVRAAGPIALEARLSFLDQAVLIPPAAGVAMD